MSTQHQPTCHISTGASAATGLTYTEGVLKLIGDADDLNKFQDFVSMLTITVLIRHNIQSFNVPELIHQLPNII